MAQIYSVNKKQLQRLINRLNNQNIFVREVKSYLETESIREATGPNILPAQIYIREDMSGVAHNLMRYKPTTYSVDGLIYGNIICYYSPKKYDEDLPPHLYLTDEQIDNITL